MGAGEGSSPHPAPTRWMSSELGARVLSAIVLGLFALFALYRGGWVFALFWLAAGVATLIEWTDMTRVAPHRPLQAALAGALVAMTGLYLAGSGFPAVFAVLGAALALALAAARGSRSRVWAATGFLYAAVLTLVPPVVRDDPGLGLVALLWMFAVVWATDIAAYFTGRRLGGPKLWPRVSPKKTWSGFGGGLAAGVLAGLAVALSAERLGWTPLFGWPAVAALSAAASVASQIGDLGESALKRGCDVKDSSHLIPGHGGVMDRVDGFWAVCALVGVALLIRPVAQ
jgi:phosphatidate cytidylyltransferase